MERRNRTASCCRQIEQICEGKSYWFISKALKTLHVPLKSLEIVQLIFLKNNRFIPALWIWEISLWVDDAIEFIIELNCHSHSIFGITSHVDKLNMWGSVPNDMGNIVFFTMQWNESVRLVDHISWIIFQIAERFNLRCCCLRWEMRVNSYEYKLKKNARKRLANNWGRDWHFQDASIFRWLIYYELRLRAVIHKWTTTTTSSAVSSRQMKNKIT